MRLFLKCYLLVWRILRQADLETLMQYFISINSTKQGPHWEVDTLSANQKLPSTVTESLMFFTAFTKAQH
jgi:hypothetical protein